MIDGPSVLRSQIFCPPNDSTALTHQDQHIRSLPQHRSQKWHHAAASGGYRFHPVMINLQNRFSIPGGFGTGIRLPNGAATSGGQHCGQNDSRRLRGCCQDNGEYKTGGFISIGQKNGYNAQYKSQSQSNDYKSCYQSASQLVQPLVLIRCDPPGTGDHQRLCQICRRRVDRPGDNIVNRRLSLGRINRVSPSACRRLRRIIGLLIGLPIPRACRRLRGPVLWNRSIAPLAIRDRLMIWLW